MNEYKITSEDELKTIGFIGDALEPPVKYQIIVPEGYVKQVLPGRDKWCAALRSNNYKQGKDYLKCGDNYCCLGVLCELQSRLSGPDEKGRYNDGLETKHNKSTLDLNNPLFDILDTCGDFPPYVRVEVNGVELSSLAECNDDEGGLTFEDIADIIEAIYEEPKSPDRDENKI